MKYLSTLILFIFSISYSFAGPIKGGWISYQAIDTNSYNVKIHLIRDCGGQALVSPKLKMFFGQQNVEFATTLYESKDISGLNPACNDTSLCDGGSLSYGFQLQSFQAQVDLDSFNACSYYISFSDTSSRTSFNGLNEEFYIYSTVDRCQLQTTNSLELVGALHLLSHRTSNQIHTLEVVDSNSAFDSISYLLVPALKDSASAITYSTSFSYDVPFIYLGFPSVPLEFDESTGNFRYSGGIGGQNAVLAFEIIGWKNLGGVMTEISKIHVDHDLIIENIGNQPPKWYGQNYLQACASQQNCWRFSSDELDTGQKVSYFISNAPAGMTSQLTDTSASAPEVEICWNPPASLSGQQATEFSLIFQDDACPFYGSSERKIVILVEGPIDSSFIPELERIRTCEGFKLRLIDTGQTGTPYDWVYDSKVTYADSLIINSQDTGWFKFNYGYSQGSCELRIYDSVFIAPPSALQAQFSGTSGTTCSNLERFISVSVQGGIPPYTYSWFDGSSLDSVSIISDTTDYWPVSILDSIGCVLNDSARVNIFPKFLADSDTLKLCNQGGTGPFKLSTRLVYGDSALLDFYWQGYGEGNGYLASIPLNKQDLALEIRDVFSCSQFDTIPIKRYAAPRPNAGLDISRCGSDTIELKSLDSLSNNASSYTWLRYGIGKTINSYFDSSSQVVLQYEDEAGCLTFDTTEIEINAIPSIYIGNDTSVCQKEKIILTALTNGGTSPYTYSWNFGTVNGNQSQFTVSGTVLVVARVTDDNLCINEDSVLIIVKSRPTVQLSTPPHLCEDSSSIFMTNFSSPQGGIWSGLGISNTQGIYKFDPSTSGGGKHWLTYSVVNNFSKCIGRDSFQANVESLVNIEFWATPPSGPSPLSVVFNNQSTGGIQNAFEWDFGDSTALSTLKNPTHFYMKSGVYPVKLKVFGDKCISQRLKPSFVFVDSFALKVDALDASVLKIYPNPAKSTAQIEIHQNERVLDLIAFNSEGKEVQIDWGLEGKGLRLEIAQLAKGNYLIIVRYSSGKGAQARLIKE